MTTPNVVLISDPRVAAVPLRECGEPLVDCRGLLRVDGRRSDPAGDWAHLRSAVAQRLLQAQKLLPEGLRWLLVEGYRSPALQQRVFRDYEQRLRGDLPSASEEQIQAAATRWVAPLETAGHTAGAAVDLTLCTGDGVELDMGCPEAATPEESGGACYTYAADLPEQARRNRALMVGALTAAGLVNYPTEWWHWSYGDRYWAWASASPHAVYGPLDRAGTPPPA